MRLEKDALGTIEVPDDVYYGAQTQRACLNFEVGDERWPVAFIRALALVKKAAAQVNAKLGLVPEPVADVIVKACDEVVAGAHDGEFPLKIWQSGSGTQTNMNMNEVLASRANELLGDQRGGKSPVHPNDHVNCAQSTNDTVPTAMHLACVMELEQNLLPTLELLRAGFVAKAEAYRAIVKIGRTHLQDATPLTLGQEFSGYAAQLEAAKVSIRQQLTELLGLAIGGTAVGTGLNAHPDFDRLVCECLADETGYAFVPQSNKFAGLAAHDAVVRLSGALRGLAAALLKIVNDVRWLGSGPRSGLGELDLPANEPGSSIMPGKVNPTQCEMVSMICCQVYGLDAALAMAGSMGQFELNVFKPLIVFNSLKAIRLLADGMRSFEKNCLAGIEPNIANIEKHVARSLMLVTALSPHVGYDKAAELALRAWRENRTLRDVAVESGAVSSEDYDRWVLPEQMTGPAS